MRILHQIYPVKDRKIVVELPDSFSAGRAEVIVLPFTSDDFRNAAETEVNTEIIRQFLSRDTMGFTVEQKEAYQRVCQKLEESQTADSPRIAGLFAGLVQISDDFDIPLPDEELFWGKQTDE